MKCVEILTCTNTPKKPLPSNQPSTTSQTEIQEENLPPRVSDEQTRTASAEQLRSRNKEFHIQKIEREIDLRLVKKAFKKNTDKIECFIKENLHDMVSRLALSGKSQTKSLVDERHICDLKVRFFQGEVQVLVKSWLGKGGFKNVEKVAHLAGPFLPHQPGAIYAYAKVERRKELRVELKKLELHLSEAIESNASLQHVSELREKRTLVRAKIESVQRSLLEETAISKECSNSHIVRMWAVSNQKDPTGIKGVMMELCEKGDLWDFVEEQSFPLSSNEIERTIELAASISQTLADIHAQGKGRCHLDMKCGNVLLTEENGKIIPKLTDFGLSKNIGAFLKHPCGTPAYMAPELYDSERNAQPSMDAWSLGIICTELFYGASANTFLFDEEALSAARDFFNHDRYPKNKLIWERIGAQITTRLNLCPAIDEVIRHLLDINPITRWTAQKAADIFNILSKA